MVKDKKYFKSLYGDISLPVFFPDATRAVLKTLDSEDIEKTKTPGILVNTYHLFQDLGRKVIAEHQGVRGFMSWKGGLISDSGGFQVMTLAKANSKGQVIDKGVIFGLPGQKKEIFTPEISIRFQMDLKPDMAVVLDDFTDPSANYEQARETVERTVLWAQRSKQEFEKCCEEQELSQEKRPYLLAVVQGGDFLDLREECCQRLAAIGFAAYGYGGSVITTDSKPNFPVAQCLAEALPKGSLLYGLGVGKPEGIIGFFDLGYDIFDCVLPTRDARHGRLYVFEADSIGKINVRKPDFYSYYVPDKEKYYHDTKPVSSACDCLLCRRYTRSYLAHLFRIQEPTAFRLATIHNLRFYSLLMEKLGEKNKKNDCLENFGHN